MVLFLGVGHLLLILVSVLLVSTWFHIRREHRHSWQRPSRLAVYLTSQGRARWVGGRRWRLSRRRQSPKGASFYFPRYLFLGRTCLVQGVAFYFLDSAGYARS